MLAALVLLIGGGGMFLEMRTCRTCRTCRTPASPCRTHPSFADADPAFFTEYLAKVDCSEVQVFAMKEGGVVFPREPLIR